MVAVRQRKLIHQIALMYRMNFHPVRTGIFTEQCTLRISFHKFLDFRRRQRAALIFGKKYIRLTFVTGHHILIQIQNRFCQKSQHFVIYQFCRCSRHGKIPAAKQSQLEKHLRPVLMNFI